MGGSDRFNIGLTRNAILQLTSLSAEDAIACKSVFFGKLSSKYCLVVFSYPESMVLCKICTFLQNFSYCAETVVLWVGGLVLALIAEGANR